MRLALTFDDGPGVSTAAMLRVLRAHGCRATFFVLGENVVNPWWGSAGVREAREILIEAARDGHVLGNHTMTHNGKTGLSDLVQEIEECDALIRNIYEEAGVAAPETIPFRLPYGIRTFVAEYADKGRVRTAAALDSRVQALASIGRGHIHWTAILPDWQARSSRDAECLFELAVDHIGKMGEQGLTAVLALHDGCQRNLVDEPTDRSITVGLVDRLLTEAKSQGWEVATVPALKRP